MQTSSSGASKNADEQVTVTEPMTDTNTEISAAATFPTWAIALIVLIPGFIIGTVACFKFVHKRHKRNASQTESTDTANERGKDASSNLLQVAATFN